MELTKFISAFHDENDIIHLRIFADRKPEDPDFKGMKYTTKLSQINSILPTLKQQNQKHNVHP
jgi:hypothetical protein